MRTEDRGPQVTPEQLERTRREVRDIVAGNTQFHVDPNAAPAPPIDVPLPTIYDDPDYFSAQQACLVRVGQFPIFTRYRRA